MGGSEIRSCAERTKLGEEHLRRGGVNATPLRRSGISPAVCLPGTEGWRGSALYFRGNATLEA